MVMKQTPQPNGIKLSMKKILSFFKGFTSVVSITFILNVFFLKYFINIAKRFNISTETYSTVSYLAIAICIIISIFLVKDIYNLLKKIANK